jgi:NADH-quinone oxidoreductase subunit J
MLITAIHCILCFLICLCSLFVAFSDSAISSIIFLILAFCNAAALLLFIFDVDFLGLIFIVIYVGAIAVLFLFVIMMLPGKAEKETNSLNLFFILFLVLFLILAIQIKTPLLFIQNVSPVYLILDDINNITALGQSFYNYYTICFLIAGIVLLIALVGSIVLTLKFNQERNNQFYTRQLSRNHKFLTLTKNK